MKPLNKIMLWKRNGRAAALKTQMDNAVARLAASVKSIVNDPDCDQNEMLGRSFGQFLDHCNGLTKSRTSLSDVAELHEIFKNDSEHAEPDLSDTNAGMPKNRRRRAGDDDDDDADETERLSADEQRKKHMVERSEQLSAMTKKYGVVAIAKSVNNKGAFLTETEMTPVHCGRTRQAHRQHVRESVLRHRH